MHAVRSGFLCHLADQIRIVIRHGKRRLLTKVGDGIEGKGGGDVHLASILAGNDGGIGAITLDLRQHVRFGVKRRNARSPKR